MRSVTCALGGSTFVKTLMLMLALVLVLSILALTLTPTLCLFPSAASSEYFFPPLVDALEKAQ